MTLFLPVARMRGAPQPWKLEHILEKLKLATEVQTELLLEEVK
jgi:hypothetical protein